MVRQTHSVFFFLLLGHVPLYACAVASVLWESCPVTRSPSCGRLHRQTVKPLPPPTCVVSSSHKRLVGRTMAPSQLQAAPTPRRCDGSKDKKTKDKKTKQTSVLDFAIWDDMAVIFSVHKAARRPAKRKHRKTQKVIAFSYDRTIQWAIRSDRPDPVLGRFWQVRKHAIM